VLPAILIATGDTVTTDGSVTSFAINDPGLLEPTVVPSPSPLGVAVLAVLLVVARAVVARARPRAAV